jgi:hypothetical protein
VRVLREPLGTRERGPTEIPAPNRLDKCSLLRRRCRLGIEGDVPGPEET